jgi:hypothetical protein
MQRMKHLSKDLLDWVDSEDSHEDSESYIQQSLLLSEPDISNIQNKVHESEKLSQLEKVKHMFIVQRDICHSEFMENYIPRFGALIWTLRHEEGWVIDKERCLLPLHNHQSPQYKYIFKGVK